MFALLLTILLSTPALADHDYKPAIKSATEAALIQSGLEADFFKVQTALLNKANKWVYKNGLTNVVAVGSAVVPVLLYKKVRVRTGKFIFEGRPNKVEGLFQLQF